ncbi:YybH family protein [Pontibacter toksunensis]|uniref:YybH family protein n=1 Tax=Pontibacter toksunensis TaxID=1332631 RepID=A0ABW6C5L3_9BACT
MKEYVFALLFLPTIGVQLAQAQSTASSQKESSFDRSQDEQAIRQMITNGISRDHYTEDIIFASGAYPRPIVGLDNLKKAVPSGGERKNFKTNPIIERVEVAGSGDMAYAYGTSTISWEGKEPFEVAFLEVFRKKGDAWKLAARFIRPHQE